MKHKTTALRHGLMAALICLIAFTGTTTLNAQNVNIPDARFKSLLVANAALNTNGDAEIQLSEAQAYTGSLYLPFTAFITFTSSPCFTSTMYNPLGNFSPNLNVCSALPMAA